MSTKSIKQKSVSNIDINSFLKSLILLLKPRVMSCDFYLCCGYITSNSTIETINAIVGIILVAIGAGAAGCLNMWYDPDIDALMTRTCLRPIPTGKITRNYALVYGLITILCNSFKLFHQSSISSFITFHNFILYISLYTC